MNNYKQLISGILAASIWTFSLTAYAADREVIQNKGSDTLVNVAQAWAEAYIEVDDSVAVAVSGAARQ
jgi:phosphate transport system substrate-binding protein